MRWQGGRRGGIEDRRGGGGGLGGPVGGGGIAVVVIALIGYFVFGIDPATLLDNSGTGSTQATREAPAITGAASDEDGQFVDVIHTSANDTWQALFDKSGETYRPSSIVVYTQGTKTGCGFGEAAMGPFYCPADEKVYIDLDFFHTMDTQLGARGDFARAYVIAHEVGHHVQKVLGTSDAVSRQQQGLSKAGGNALSVKLELQADCYAGVWANQSDAKMKWIEAGDIDEALGAATAVGDDTLQQRSQGRVVPDSFTHGTSAQRAQWFKKGFSTGDPNACDTFS